MRMLNDIFPIEADAKIAEGLVTTLRDSEHSLTAQSLIRKSHLQESPSKGFGEIFKGLSMEGYIKLGELSQADAMTVHPNSIVTIHPEARNFIDMNYTTKNDNRR